MKFDGITCRAIVLELNKKIVGGHVKKINQIGPHTLTMHIYAHRSNQLLYLSSDPSKALLYLTNRTYENPKSPPNFVMFLRKHLGQGKITEIAQLGMDRTVRISFETHNEMGDPEKKDLYCEFMGRYSNLILVSQEGTVLDAMKRVSGAMSRVRQVYPGSSYKVFPAEKIEILEKEVDARDLIREMSPKAQVNKIFIQKLTGFSPLAAREIAFRAGVEPDMAIEKLSQGQIEKLNQVLQTWILAIRQGNFEPSYYGPPDGAFYPFPLYHLGKPDLKDPSLSYLIDLFRSFEGRDDKVGQKKEALHQVLQKEVERLEKKKLKLGADYEQTLNRDEIKEEADLLSADLYRMKKGQTEIKVSNFFKGGEEKTILLDPKKSPWENVEYRYHKYSKLKTANKLLRLQIPKMENQLRYLRQLSLMLDQAESLEDLEEIKNEMKDEGLIKKPSHRQKNKEKTPQALPPRKFQSPSGFSIFVGRNNRQNDQLTLKEAGKEDFFFHAKTIPGAHVILFAEGKVPSQEDIEAAAFLAAKYSSQGQEPFVDVDYTEKKNVYKAKGAKPGMVYYKEFKTIRVSTLKSPPLQDLEEKKE